MTPLVIVFLLWVGVTVSTEVDLQKRIIGGKPCQPTERQYHVKLSVDPTGHELYCGGSLISDQWILTAAHCKIPNMYAVLGVHPGPGQVVFITAPPVIFMDKDINNNDRIHDIMLLKLPSSTNIKPVPLPDCGNGPNVPIGAMVQVAGHGSTVTGPNNKIIEQPTSTLQCANIKVVDCQVLRDILMKHKTELYNKRKHFHWMCGQTSGVDISIGDSGGGVVYQHKIYGVISQGDDIAFTEPAAFMDICYQPYFDWIKQTIAKKH